MADFRHLEMIADAPAPGSRPFDLSDFIPAAFYAQFP